MRSQQHGPPPQQTANHTTQQHEVGEARHKLDVANGNIAAGLVVLATEREDTAKATHTEES